MIKFVNHRRNGKKGFTLVEVIIALAIFALFSLVIATMFMTVFKIHFNTNEIDTQMDKQITVLDVRSTEEYDNAKSFTIEFDGVTDVITSNGEKVAKGANDNRIPIRVFD